MFTPRRVAASIAAAALLLGAGAALAAPAWITIGEKAHNLLMLSAPESRLVGAQRVSVDAPVERGIGVGKLRLKRVTEMVYAMQVDEDALPLLSDVVHQQLHKCGGYMRHDSEAEALATLHRLGTAPAAERAPSYIIDNQDKVTALLPNLQASNILSTITSLASFQNRRHQSSHGVAASNWLYDQWRQMAPHRRDVRVAQITHTGFAQKSVMMEIVGSSNSKEVIVLGGHLDSIVGGNVETVRAPGADDDASGIASMTEVMRVLLSGNYTPKRTLRFIAYAAEEAGLLGSKQVVAALPGQRTTVVGVMQLDMTAYKGDATDLWIYTDYTNAAQNQFLADLASSYLPQLTVGYDRCGYGCSDHASWHAAGYAVSFPFEASDATYNMRIHTVNDTVANFGGQANHALKFSQLALAYMIELGSDGP